MTGLIPGQNSAIGPDGDRAKLRELAEKATPGPWASGDPAFGDGNAQNIVSIGGLATGRLVQGPSCAPALFDVEYIAAANPAAVLDLLKDVEPGGWRKVRVLIDQMIEALGLSDDMTRADAQAALDGCNCNGEEGSEHLLWHLRQKLARAEGRALAAETAGRAHKQRADRAEAALVAATRAVITAEDVARVLNDADILYDPDRHGTDEFAYLARAVVAAALDAEREAPDA